MKKALKIFGGLLGLLGVLVLGLITYMNLAFPKVGPANKDLKIELTAERVKRGEYLAKNVAGCISCHSPRQFDTQGYMPVKGQEFSGGFELSKYVEDLPGYINSPNLTTLQDHTDGEIYRAIAEGVRKDGKPIFPMMQYLAYGETDKEDIYSIIAYLRTLKPVGEKRPQSELKPPFNLIFRTVPKVAAHQPRPDDKKDPVAHGAYLVKMAACFDCHTPWDDKHQPLPGLTGAGGGEFPMAFEGRRFMIRTANITPDIETGIGSWDEAMFVRVIRERAKRNNAYEKLEPGEPNSHMGYWEYAGMTDQDLSAIYKYLRTLKPIKSSVVRFEKL